MSACRAVSFRQVVGFLLQLTPAAAAADAIVFHTGSNRPESGDYFELMEANVARLLLQ